MKKVFLVLTFILMAYGHEDVAAFAALVAALAAIITNASFINSWPSWEGGSSASQEEKEEEFFDTTSFFDVDIKEYSLSWAEELQERLEEKALKEWAARKAPKKAGGWRYRPLQSLEGAPMLKGLIIKPLKHGIELPCWGEYFISPARENISKWYRILRG